MAWRIDEAVIRGEIDNRIRGRVTGRIWFTGRDEPVTLELAGNAWRDLAGRRLEFVNPHPKSGGKAGIAPHQSGVIGDCTASRKVKVPDVSMEEVLEAFQQRKPFPWHWGNSLYLEWFSEANGRVVIESATFVLTIDPESAWEMTEPEEETQRRANASALGGFMTRLGELASADSAGTGEDAAEPPPQKPLSEAEAERMHAESERLVDRIEARVEREGIENYERILEEELERRRRERGEPTPTPEEQARHDEWPEHLSRAAEEAAASADPEAESELSRRHPLSKRAFEFSVRLMQEPEDRGWIPTGASPEHPVVDVINAVTRGSVKLAGALDGCRWPPDIDGCASALVRLKRASEFFSHALLALDFCGEQHLAESQWLAEAAREVTTLRAECDALIAELRSRLDEAGA